MELYQLRSFIMVADTGNLTQASEQLFTSQPAVSAHIKALEEELAIKLFTRTARGMQLTEHGCLLKEKAIKVLDSSHQLKIQAQTLTGDVSGIIKIGLNTDSEYLRLTSWHNDLIERFPNLKVELVQNTSFKLLKAIESGLLDIGFISREFEGNALESVNLYNSQAVVAASPQWAQQIKSADIEQLALLPWIQPEPLCIYHQFINELFADSANKPNKVTTSASEESTLKLLLSGVGLSVIRDDEAEELLKNHEIVVWTGRTFSLPLHLAYAKKRRDDPLIKSLLAVVSAHFSIG